MTEPKVEPPKTLPLQSAKAVSEWLSSNNVAKDFVAILDSVRSEESKLAAAREIDVAKLSVPFTL